LPPITERAAQPADLNREIGLLDVCAWPYARDQLFLADELAGAFEQRDENIEGTTADLDRLAVLGEQPLHREHAERAERGRRCGGMTDHLRARCHIGVLAIG